MSCDTVLCMHIQWAREEAMSGSARQVGKSQLEGEIHIERCICTRPDQRVNCMHNLKLGNYVL